MDKEKKFSAAELLCVLAEDGLAKIGDIEQLKAGLWEHCSPKDGAEREETKKDIDCAIKAGACVAALINDVLGAGSAGEDIYFGFYMERTDPSQCLDLIVNGDKEGFGFYTRGIAKALDIKWREAVNHGANISKEARLLAIAARRLRLLLLKRNAVKPYGFLDIPREIQKDFEFGMILSSLSMLRQEIDRGLEMIGKPGMSGREMDGIAIEIYAAKMIEKGTSVHNLVRIIRKNAAEEMAGPLEKEGGKEMRN